MMRDEETDSGTSESGSDSPETPGKVRADHDGESELEECKEEDNPLAAEPRIEYNVFDCGYLNEDSAKETEIGLEYKYSCKLLMVICSKISQK